MKNKKVWVVVALLLVLGCLTSAFFSYRAGFAWGRRAGQRGALRLSGIVDVYGCGVDRFVQIAPNSPVPLHEFLKALQPLPTEVNGVAIRMPNSTGLFSVTLTQALATNGVGTTPLSGGESVILVHQFN